jgi:hypothetical protein
MYIKVDLFFIFYLVKSNLSYNNTPCFFGRGDVGQRKGHLTTEV